MPLHGDFLFTTNMDDMIRRKTGVANIKYIEPTIGGGKYKGKV